LGDYIFFCNNIFRHVQKVIVLAYTVSIEKYCHLFSWSKLFKSYRRLPVVRITFNIFELFQYQFYRLNCKTGMANWSVWMLLFPDIIGKLVRQWVLMKFYGANFGTVNYCTPLWSKATCFNLVSKWTKHHNKCFLKYNMSVCQIKFVCIDGRQLHVCTVSVIG
jgi:hypothetical protein